MKRIRLDLENSGMAITLALLSATVITAILTRPDLSELRQWRWDTILGHVVGLILVVGMGWTTSYGIAEQMMKDKPRSRVASYTVCLLALFAASVLLGSMWSTSVEPGDELDESQQNTCLRSLWLNGMR